MTTKIQKAFDEYKKEMFVPFCCSAIRTNIEKGKEKKQFKPPLEHEKITLENCDNYKSGSTICIGTGKRSNLTVIDFDNLETYNEVIKKNPELTKCRTIKTNKGFHIYFKYEPTFTNRADAFIGLSGVDIRNDKGFVFAAPTIYKLLDNSFVKYEDLGGDIIEMPQYFKELNKTKQIKIKEENENEKIKEEVVLKTPVKTEDYKIINNIVEDGLLDHKVTSFTDWMDVGMAMKECVDIETFHKFSQRCFEKYDKNSTIKAWNSIKGNKGKKLTIGSLIFWAKENPLYDGRFDKKKVELVKEEEEVSSLTDKDVGELLFNQYKHKIINNNGVLYAYYKHHWNEDIKMVFKQWIQMSDININGPKSKPSLVGSLTSKFENYITQLNCFCIERIDSVNLLNQTKDIIKFKDGYYNFKTQKFNEYNDEEVIYITFKINRNFPKNIDLHFTNEIKRVIYDMFNNVEAEVDEYFSFNARALSNHIEDKVGRIVVGERNSGKGVITYLNALAFDGVIGTVDNKELAFKKGSFESAERRNGFLKNFCDNLLCITEEVDTSNKIDGTLWKTITSGGDKINYRTAYGHLAERVPLKALYSINCNKTPSFSLNDAAESMILYNMPCKYVDEIPIDDCDRGFVMKLGDHTIKSRLSTEKYIDAYTLFVLSFYKNTRPKYQIMTEMAKDNNEVEDEYIDTKDKLAITVASLYTINLMDKTARIKRAEVHKSILNKFPETTPQKIKVFLTNKNITSVKTNGIFYYQSLNYVEEKMEFQ